MEKQYFVWKDPNCNGINPEWIQLTPKQFLQLVNDPKNSHRFFAKLTDGGCEEAGVLVMEATESVYRECEQARLREKYLRHLDREYQDSVVSLNAPVPDNEELLFEEIVGDPKVNTEAKALHCVDLVKLKAALDKLTPEELEIINALFLENHNKRGERAVAKELGIPQRTLNDRKKKILKKL
ncbi:MAG: hypothetical protein ACI3W5_05450 [Faecousia sp.]